MAYGVFVPLRPIGFTSVAAILEEHLEVIKEHGEAYFSTSIRINPKKGEDLKYLLIRDDKKFYLGKVKGYRFFEGKGIPKDSDKLSPSKYSNIPEKHWFKLVSLNQVSEEVVRTLLLVNDEARFKYHDVATYLECSPRIQTFYWMGGDNL